MGDMERMADSGTHTFRNWTINEYDREFLLPTCGSVQFDPIDGLSGDEQVMKMIN